MSIGYKEKLPCNDNRKTFGPYIKSKFKTTFSKKKNLSTKKMLVAYQ